MIHRPPPWFRLCELGISAAALVLALVINNWAGHMATAAGDAAFVSPDLLLGALPRWDTSFLFVYGFAAFLVWLLIAIVLWERHRAPYIVWSYALVILVRSFFIILTPMHQPSDSISVQGLALFDVVGKYLTFQNDLFFSSHTAMPYLAYLLIRGPWVQASFFLISLMMAATVLFGHLHYSIDVFAAYFITYAAHKLEVRWFQPFYRRLRARVILQI